MKVGASIERRKWRSEIKGLKKELRQREEVIVCSAALPLHGHADAWIRTQANDGGCTQNFLQCVGGKIIQTGIVSRRKHKDLRVTLYIFTCIW